MKSLTWRDRTVVVRVSTILRARQGWNWLRTAAEVGWYRHVLQGRVYGLPSEIINGEVWHLIQGKAAARRAAAGQVLTTPQRFLADIYIRTEHSEPAYVRLDEAGRVAALMFVREGDGGTCLLQTIPAVIS